MKLSVSAWTEVQEALPKNEGQGSIFGLWGQIERRTFGKRWSDEIGIRLTKEQERMVREICADRKLRIVTKVFKPCDHTEPDPIGGVPIQWDEWTCPICDGTGKKLIIRREIPVRPEED